MCIYKSKTNKTCLITKTKQSQARWDIMSHFVTPPLRAQSARHRSVMETRLCSPHPKFQLPYIVPSWATIFYSRSRERTTTATSALCWQIHRQPHTHERRLRNANSPSKTTVRPQQRRESATMDNIANQLTHAHSFKLQNTNTRSQKKLCTVT